MKIGKHDDIPFKPIALSERFILTRFFKWREEVWEKRWRISRPSDSGRPAITSERSRVVQLTHLESNKEQIVEQPSMV